jgi:hypothetical protein
MRMSATLIVKVIHIQPRLSKGILYILSAMPNKLSYEKAGFVRVVTRETREGWNVLTVETKANGDSKSTN